jgi:hypothetical protein
MTKKTTASCLRMRKRVEVNYPALQGGVFPSLKINSRQGSVVVARNISGFLDVEDTSN